MNNLCRYVFQHRETNHMMEYVHSLQTIESGYIKKLMVEMDNLGYDLISRDWWSGLCDQINEVKLFYNDKMYDKEFDCYGVVNYLDETTMWVIDWDDDSRDGLFDVISDKKRKVYKVGTIYDLSKKEGLE